MQRQTATALALALLLASAAAVALPTPSALSFSQAAVESGTLSGELRALRASTPSSNTARVGVVNDLSGDPALHGDLLGLKADVLQVTRQTYSVDQAVAGQSVQGQRGSAQSNFTSATLVAREIRAQQALFVAPQDAAPATFQWDVGSGNLSASSGGSTSQDSNVADPTPRTFAADGATSWAGQEAGSLLTVRGDLYIALYDIDVAIDSSEGHSDASSGYTFQNVGGVAPQQPVLGTDETSVLEIVARNAVLTWAPANEPSVFAYLSDVSLSAPTSLRLDDAQGTIGTGSQSAPVSNQEVVAPAGSRLDHVQVDGSRMKGDLTLGDPSVLVGGRRIEFPQSTTGPAPHAKGWAAWAWLAGTAVVLGAAVVLYVRPPFQVVTTAMDARRYRFVVRTADRFLSMPERAARASVMKAIALFGLERPEDAKRFLEGLPASSRPEGPTMAYLLAMVRVWEGRDDEAVRLLGECLEEAPEYRHEILANPMFARLLDRPTTQALVFGEGYS